MRYTVDPELRKRVVDQLLLRESEDTGRVGEAASSSVQQASLPLLHVSDLIVSLPQTWYRMHGGAEEFTESSKQNMAFGVNNQRVLKLIPGIEVEVEVRRLLRREGDLAAFADLVGHVDGVEAQIISSVRSQRFPWEVKTTLSGYKNSPSVHYFEQLGAYAYMLGAREGVLLTLHRGDRENIFKAGIVEWEPEELETWWEEITRRAYLLLSAPDIRELEGEQYAWSWGYSPQSFQEAYPDMRGGTYDGFFGSPL